MSVNYIKDGKMVNMHLNAGVDERGKKRTIAQAIVAVLAKKGLQGDIQAIKELLDRTLGKAIQPIVNTTVEDTEHLDSLTDEELEQYLVLKEKASRQSED